MALTFLGNPITLTTKEIRVGEKAPAFRGTLGDMSEFNSENLKGKVVAYSVVPSLDTGVCSVQTTRFNKEAAALGDDVAIVTVSLDLPFAQGRFCQAEAVDKVVVVSDYKDREFGEKFGFLIDELKLLTRGIVVVDKEGVVSYVEYVEEVSTEVNFDKALEAIKSLL